MNILGRGDCFFVFRVNFGHLSLSFSKVIPYEELREEEPVPCRKDLRLDRREKPFQSREGPGLAGGKEGRQRAGKEHRSWP
jgi:hypothetical protein